MKKSLSIGFFALVGTVAAHQTLSSVYSENSGFLQEQNPSLEAGINNFCTYNAGGSFYNLIGLKNQSGYYETEVKDFPNWKVVFNFCKEITPKNTNCPIGTFAGLVNYNSNVTECYSLAKNQSDIEGILDKARDYNGLNLSSSVQDQDQKKGRLQLTYKNKASGCPLSQFSSSNSSLKLVMVCDPSAKIPVVYEATFDTLCQASLAVRSKDACYDFSINPLIKWIGQQPLIIGISLVVLGFVLGLMGKRFFKISLFLVGSTVLTVVSTLFVFSVFLSRDSSNTTGWLIFSGCLLVSMIGGLILAKFFRFGVAVAAGWGGVVLALILYNSFVYKIDGSSKVVFWIFVVLMGVITASLSFYFCWPAVIMATSVAGAYAIIRGISLKAGGYPSELEIIQDIKNGQFTSMPGSFYAYMAGFFVLAIFFMVWQFKKYGLESETDKDGQKKIVSHYHKIGGKKSYAWRK